VEACLSSGDHEPRLSVPAGWRVALAVVLAGFLTVGVALLIARAAGFSRVRESLSDADARWFVVCFLAECVAFGAYAFVLRDAMERGGGPRLRYRLSLHLTFASLGATRVIAAAGAGGLAVAWWCFWRAGYTRGESLIRVLGLNTLVYLVFGVGAWVAALLATIGVLGAAPLSLTLPWLVVIPVCIVAARFVTQPGIVERMTRPGGSFVRRGFGYAVAGTSWVRSLLGSRDSGLPLVSSAAYWAGDAACLWAALHSVGQPIPVAELALAYATGYAATILPLPFGGVGGVEAAMTYALTAVGVPLAPALVAVAVYRLFGFWVPTVPALGALVLLPRAGRALERAATAT
jgi:uncharacterized membrane protein YbhN (UPF0104 family)